ncbi:MAG: hypothetical protein ACI89L_001164 [Phycisphaerales bacterium]|jgi:hypothetical protein
MTTPTPTGPAPDEIQTLLSLLRAHAAGILRCDETPEPIRFVYSRQDQGVILPLEPRLLDSDQFLLCLPDDSFDLSVRALLHVVALNDEREIDRDRHMAYHGSTTEGVWVLGRIEHAHSASGLVIDGELLTEPGSLAADEPRLCKRLNADRAALADAIELFAGVRIAEPLAVGVDPHGFDVRARHGIVRVAFPSPCTNGDTAARVISTMIEPSDGA